MKTTVEIDFKNSKSVSNFLIDNLQIISNGRINELDVHKSTFVGYLIAFSTNGNEKVVKILHKIKEDCGLPIDLNYDQNIKHVSGNVARSYNVRSVLTGGNSVVSHFIKKYISNNKLSSKTRNKAYQILKYAIACDVISMQNYKYNLMQNILYVCKDFTLLKRLLGDKEFISKIPKEYISKLTIPSIINDTVITKGKFNRQLKRNLFNCYILIEEFVTLIINAYEHLDLQNKLISDMIPISNIIFNNRVFKLLYTKGYDIKDLIMFDFNNLNKNYMFNDIKNIKVFANPDFYKFVNRHSIIYNTFILRFLSIYQRNYCSYGVIMSVLENINKNFDINMFIHSTEKAHLITYLMNYGTGPIHKIKSALKWFIKKYPKVLLCVDDKENTLYYYIKHVKQFHSVYSVLDKTTFNGCDIINNRNIDGKTALDVLRDDLSKARTEKERSVLSRLINKFIEHGAN